MTVPAAVPEPAGVRRSRIALAVLMGAAGLAHLAAPRPFDDLVPRWLPGSARTYTLLSGVGELACAGLLARQRTARVGGLLTAAVLVGVYPANIQDAVDRFPPVDGRGWASLVRLPMQLPLILWALRHGRRPRPLPSPPRDRSTARRTRRGRGADAPRPRDGVSSAP